MPGPSFPAQAAVPAERGDGPVRGIVATRSTSGTKTDTPILENPQAVSVVSAEQISLQKAQNLGEAVRYSPGIQGNYYGADTRNDWFNIRGFEAQTRGYFLDNLSLQSTAFGTFKMEPFGMERIEVLRGPSSVLYGGTNPGGMVNAISKKPLFSPFGYVETGVDNFGRVYGAFDVGGPIAIAPRRYESDGTFAYRMTGLIANGGTQTDHTDNDRYYIAPSFTWKPTEDTKLTVLGSFTRDETNGQNFLPYYGTVRPAEFGYISTKTFTSDRNLDRFQRNQAFIGYQFEHKFSDVFTFRQNLRYSYLDIDFRSVYGGGYASPGVLSRFNFGTQPRANVFNVDNSVEAKFATGFLQHTALLGLDYRRYILNDNQAFLFGTPFNFLTGYGAPNTPLTVANRYRNYQFVQDQLGVYLQDQIKFGHFTLALSGRYDAVSTDTNNRLSPSTSNSIEEGRFSGRAGLIYTSDWGLAPYVAYSNSFSPQIGVSNSLNRPLRSELGEQFEAGVKYQPLGWNSFVGVTAFDLRRQNMTTTSLGTDGLPFTTQTGEVRSRGLEFEAVANPMPGLKFIASYTIFDLENTKVGNAPASLVLRGKTPINTPESFGGVFADYTFQHGPLAGFGFGGGLRYVGRSFADPSNLYKVPSVFMGDAQVHYERAGWRFAVNVANLTDERYVASCNGINACYYGDRRKITGSISYKW